MFIFKALLYRRNTHIASPLHLNDKSSNIRKRDKLHNLASPSPGRRAASPSLEDGQPVDPQETIANKKAVSATSSCFDFTSTS